jgi:methionyl-tRNA synthetase
MKHFYITTPIYYVNDKPHIGHAYTTIASDVMARFQRLNGVKTLFLTGTDEHGQKVQKSAEILKRNTYEFVTEKAECFIKMNKMLNISNDDFIRTTENRHITSVAAFWNRLLDAGYIYLDKYSGWYSMRDEAFYSDNELTAEGLAPTGATVEWLEEESYFFKLSAFQEQLLEFYELNPNFILPKYRMKEVKNFVKSGLYDLSISRTSFDWGIKVPHDDKHVIYVWLDALTNYISALGYPDDIEGKFVEFWPAQSHVIGKDILRFHAVYWPAFLMAANLPLPKQIIAHGWWMNEGSKMSKSIGNVIDPVEIVAQYNVDAFRYFLLREMAFGNDGNFSAQNLVLRNNAELANKIGNLFQRTLALVHKYYEGRVPVVNVTHLYQETLLLQQVLNLHPYFTVTINDFSFNIVLEIIVRFVDNLNEYINEVEPWQLVKHDKDTAGQALYIVMECLRYIAILLQPFIPSSAEAMLDQLNIDLNQRDFYYLKSDFAMKSGAAINAISPIFNKFDVTI